MPHWGQWNAHIRAWQARTPDMDPSPQGRGSSGYCCDEHIASTCPPRCGSYRGEWGQVQLATDVQLKGKKSTLNFHLRI